MNPFSSLSDEDLMLRYKDGDAMAFEVLYDRHQEMIYSYLRRRLPVSHPNSNALDDIFQKVFLKVHKHRNKYTRNHPFKKWLYVVARSVLLDHLKSPSHQRKDSTFEDQNHLNLESIQRPEDFFEALQNKKLNSREIDILTQRFFYDQDFQDIAQSLQTTPTNIRKILSRALKKIRLETKKQGQSL